MSDEIQKFAHERFGNLRVLEDGNGNPLFCAKDVAVALGYKRPSDAISQHCKGAVIHRPLQTPGGVQQVRFITEGDMYRLIASSKLESAIEFESWVFDDVLPSIRRDGGYMVAREDEPDESIMARALLIAQKTIERTKMRNAELEAQNSVQAEQIEEMRPKALFADAVSASDGTCLVGEVAKMLRQTGVRVGQNRLFEWLRRDGLLGKSGCNRNVPTQYAMENGWFKIKETTVVHSDGHVTLNRTPKVTGRGQRYLIKRYGDCDSAGMVVSEG